MAGWHEQELGQTLGDGEEQEAWRAAVHGVTKRQTRLNNSLTLCDLMDCSPPGSSPLSMAFSSKNTRVGCRVLLQCISSTQGLNLRLLSLLHWQEDSLPLGHLGSLGKSPSSIIIQDNIYSVIQQ